ncbi:hypothetical protein GBAR_LOCUS7879 [Geodia barretti]|uniref:Putative restriction endonuclease domain-containing protein n=1 Tax=Geodia barretti TaxID=519541 RepID=A0AA35WG44_GEOBA|nr:hypothetical protein GBAR_LOCUS7879 [Geodia barretti]
MVQVKPKAKLTYDDYANLPGDERYELIDGELILVASPREIHQRILKILFRMIVAAEDSGLGWPDLLFISKDRLDIITAANVQGAPDLVVEILSPSTSRLDRSRKRELYERHQVKEMWLVDPEDRKISVLLLKDGKLDVVGEYSEGQSFSSATLGGLSIDLDKVFQSEVVR